MLTPQLAWEMIVDQTTPLAPLPLPLFEADRHYLAEDIPADRDIPPADRSAMDGYAVRSADLSGQDILLCVGEVAAGSSAAPVVEQGTCARIFTGGNIPPGADAVLMQEHVTVLAPDRIRCEQVVNPGQNVFRRGENAGQGEILARAGELLTPMTIGVCAAVGKARPVVHALPTVAVVATGEELLDASAKAAAHQLRNSNGPTLAATLKQHGFPVISQTGVADDSQLLRDHLSSVLELAEVVITTGGVSVGDYDLVPRVVEELGLTTRYHGVEIKPGKPQLFATAVEDKYLFGLPGNPLSSLVGLQEFVLPALRRLAGCPPTACRPIWRLPVGKDIKCKGKREQHVLVEFVDSDNGMVAMPVPTVGSADLVAAGLSAGALIIPKGITEVAAGDVVTVRPWRSQ